MTWKAKCDETTALLVFLYEDEHTDTSEAELRCTYTEGRVGITPSVYAELATDGHFETSTELDQFLADFSIQSGSKPGQLSYVWRVKRLLQAKIGALESTSVLKLLGIATQE